MNLDSILDEHFTPKVGVIIPTHNRWSIASRSLQCLITDRYRNKQIYLIDDGCTDETKGQVSQLFPDINVLNGDGSLWWSGAINLGLINILQHNFDLILWLNDDNYVEEETIQRLVNAHICLGQNSIVAARTKSLLTNLDEWQGNPPRWHPHYETWNKVCGENEYMPLEHPPGGRGVLFPVHCFREVGLVDNKSFPHYWADHDFHYRAMKAGFQYFLVGDAVVWNVPNTPENTIPEAFSVQWITRFLFSRRSPMNLITVRRLLKRHLDPTSYRRIWPPMCKSTIFWLLTEWGRRRIDCFYKLWVRFRP